MLDRMERKDRTFGELAVASHLLMSNGICKIGSRSMAGVLDYPETILIRQLAELLPIYRVACKIHRHNALVISLRMAFKLSLELFIIHQECFRIDIAKLDISAAIADAVRGSDECQWSDDHSVARLYAQRES